MLIAVVIIYEKLSLKKLREGVKDLKSILDDLKLKGGVSTTVISTTLNDKGVAILFDIIDEVFNEILSKLG